MSGPRTTSDRYDTGPEGPEFEGNQAEKDKGTTLKGRTLEAHMHHHVHGHSSGL